MKKLSLLVLTSLFLVACSPANDTSTSMQQGMENTGEEINQEMNETGDSVQNAIDTDNVTVLSLTAQNNSGQTGSARISKMSETQTKVELMMSGGTYTQPQPAHIHTGSCQTPGPVVYPLTNIEDGRSETVLDARYEDIIDPQDAEYLINVHESAAKIDVYTSCVEWDD